MMTWAIVLLIAAVLIFIIELFIPSGGILGFLAFMCLTGGVICLFIEDTTLGVIALVLSIVLVPVVAIFALKIFPKTPVGKRLILSAQHEATDTLKLDPVRDEAPADLVGRRGVAVTDLRPVGTCRVDDKRLECLAEASVIEAGTNVEVVSVHGIEVKVRAV